jgi:hypothetical protein
MLAIRAPERTIVTGKMTLHDAATHETTTTVDAMTRESRRDAQTIAMKTADQMRAVN